MQSARRYRGVAGPVQSSLRLQELDDQVVDRRSNELVVWSLPLDMVRAQQYDSTREELRLADVVCHQDQRLVEPRKQLSQIVLQVVTHHRIQRAQWLIEQQQIKHQGSHQADTLPLSA